MIKPGDVVTALLPGVSETKRRPAVVISTPAYHAARPDVILALITGRVEKADTEFDCVLFEWEAAGLKLPSAMRSFLFTKPASHQNRAIVGSRLARSPDTTKVSVGDLTIIEFIEETRELL